MNFIIIKFRVEGLHRWVDCNLSEVEYLTNLHRHEFYFEIEKQVKKIDREIEFIIYKRQIINYLKDKYFDVKYKCLNFDGMSCEMIADELLKCFGLSRIKVFEDNEHGALCIK